MIHLSWLSILSGVLLGEYLLVVLYFQRRSDTVISAWYADFKIYALLFDILIILIGYAVMNILCSVFRLKSFWLYLFILLWLQITHDFLFYFFVVKPSKNIKSPLWVFWQEYSNKNGVNAIAGDSLMFLVMTPLIFLSQHYLSPNVQALIALISAYGLLYRVFLPSDYKIRVS
jgi:hypothetical protein